MKNLGSFENRAPDNLSPYLHTSILAQMLSTRGEREYETSASHAVPALSSACLSRVESQAEFTWAAN